MGRNREFGQAVPEQMFHLFKASRLFLLDGAGIGITGFVLVCLEIRSDGILSGDGEIDCVNYVIDNEAGARMHAMQPILF
ncbi:MAG: hypothetical protein BWY82_02652 [Verrucomicrobia bacterium ADurb.Bin474]|nr:MAG: hypothetical protein BWY82_02652 [Verrucomicrobia bacterium ADurb.Bin474]